MNNSGKNKTVIGAFVVGAVTLVVAAVMAGIHYGISESVEPIPMTPERAKLGYEAWQKKRASS